MVRFKLFFLIILLSWSVCAQDRGLTDGWDLTYETILKRNNVASHELIRLWLKESKSPAEEWMAEAKAQRC
jgi:hypothetical protein